MSTDGGARATPERIHSRATIAYVTSVWLVALGLVWIGLVVTGPPHNLAAVVVLAGLGIASWLLRETDVGARVQLSFISIILLAAVVIVGPLGAAAVGALATILQFERQPLIVRLFNIALFSSMGSLGGLVYVWVGGDADPTSAQSATTILVMVGLPLIVADVAQCLLNAVFLAGVLRVATGTPVRTQIIKLLSTTGLAYIGYGVIGFLFVVLWLPAGVGWFSAVLVLAPLFVARWAFVQYGDELRAHDRTLRALVTAVETKEPHNAGHSERVAQLCEWLTEAIGLTPKEIQDVRTAGMLHDIGKIGLPTRLLRARHELTDDELVMLAEHALGGVELVSGIDFLQGALDGIAHHHERYDGRGYPAGLVGDKIPLSARVVAVADVFDALTTARDYRPALSVQDALGVLHERVGTQFDPAVVTALDKALTRHEWTPTEGTPELFAAAGAALDHDEPQMSDLFVRRADLRARLQGAPGAPLARVGGRA